LASATVQIRQSVLGQVPSRGIRPRSQHSSWIPLRGLGQFCVTTSEPRRCRSGVGTLRRSCLPGNYDLCSRLSAANLTHEIAHCVREQCGAHSGDYGLGKYRTEHARVNQVVNHGGD